MNNLLLLYLFAPDFESEKTFQKQEKTHWSRKTLLNIKEAEKFIKNNNNNNSFHIEIDNRTLVFDIDADDYGDLRTCPCGKDKKICSLCWCFVECAAYILTEQLIERFGFDLSQIFWFFTGNRGLHIHVKFGNEHLHPINFEDPEELNELQIKQIKQARKSLTRYFSLNERDKITPEYFKQDLIAKDDTLKIYEAYFSIVMKNMNYFASNEGTKKLSFALSPPMLFKLLSLPFHKREKFFETLIKCKVVSKPTLYYTLLYPRIDTNVNNSLVHNIRIPLTYHSGAKRRGKYIPTLTSLKEINSFEYSKNTDSLFKKRVKDWIEDGDKTYLKTCKIEQEFFNK